MTDEPHKPARRGTGAMVLAGLAFVVAALVGLALLVRSKRAIAREDANERAERARRGPRLLVTTVTSSAPERRVTVIGETRPFYEATLYAKLSGYVRSVRVDRGDRVREGQLLAVVESPETEQQYLAALASARNARDIAARNRALVRPGVISQQDYETYVTTQHTAEANVGYVGVFRGYRELRAPFAGTITARYADPGALAQNATGNQVGSLPIVRVSTVDCLRVFGYLQQRDATLVRLGDVAEIRLPDRPEFRVSGPVARTASELDPRTRTLLVEVDVDNRDGRVAAGSFVQMSLALRTPSYPEVPDEALVIRGTRTLAAVVGDDDHVHFRELQILDDDGTRARVLSGLRPGERVALHVGDAVRENMLVRPAPVPSAVGGGP